MHQRGALAEGHDEAQQRRGFRCGLLGTVDAGEVRREVDGDAIAEIDEIATAGCYDRTQHFPQGTRKHFRLVVTEEATPENTKLEQATLPVSVTVQGEQSVRHDHSAFVIQRLREMLVTQGSQRIRHAVETNRGHGSVKSAGGGGGAPAATSLPKRAP